MASVKYIPLDPGLIGSSPSVVDAAVEVDNATGTDANPSIMDHAKKEHPHLHVVIFPPSKEELSAVATLPESPAATPAPTPTWSSSIFFPHPLFIFLLLLLPVVLALFVYSLIEFIMPQFVLLVHNL